MGGIIYIDLLIAQNLFMNFFLLYLLVRLTNSKASIIRIFLASFIGALYVIVLLFPSLHIMYSLICKVIVSFIMVYITFIPKTIKLFIKNTCIFYVITFLMGGGIIALFYLIYGDINSLNGAMLLSKISSEFIIIGSIITTVFVKIGFDIFDEYYRGKNIEVELEVHIGEKSCTLKGFIDTGNHLKDPSSNSKVIVTYIGALKNILQIKEGINESLNKDEIIKLIEKNNLSSRMKIIPFNAVGVQGGILAGIRTDMIIARGRKSVKVSKNITLAIQEKPFLGEVRYDAIAYPEILN